MECECINCASHKCPKELCNSFQCCTRKRAKEGMKGVDILLQKGDDLYLIEMKDYRKNPSPPTDHIASEVAKKFRDSLFVLWCAGIAAEKEDEKRLADSVRRRPLNLHFVFHYESPMPAYATGLFSPKSGVLSLSTVSQKLKEKMSFMKEHLRIMNNDALKNNPDLPWKVKDISPTQ